MTRHKKHIEVVAWGLALLAPLFINPYSDNHFSFCVFNMIGFTWCPGCGLGRSIAFLYRGEWLLSFQTHWLGMAAVIMLGSRFFTLMYREFKPLNKTLYESENAHDVARGTTR